MKSFFEKMIHHSIQRKATDIHIIIKEESKIVFRIRSEIQHYQEISNEEGNKLLNYIRFIASIDINYRWQPQTGQVSFYYKKHNYYLRVSSLPTPKSDSIVIRILNNHQKLVLEDVSMFSQTREFLQQITKKSSGLFLISGATGSGKSTTLYAMLDRINRNYQRNIITLEDPIEIEKGYALQIQVQEDLGITYKAVLKQVLRHDPDVIMIGEIRDEETAKLAITCALTGHLVLSTVHASNCLTSLKRMEYLGISTLDLKDVLIGVMNQTMIYDQNREIVILSEYVTKKEIIEYLNEGKVNYFDYEYFSIKLVEEYNIDKKKVEEYI